uniref:Translation initiation factor IF-2, chloroplastic n=1 Tax=Porphyridium sordidum TaxID=28024 RepID=A0A1C9CDR5_PORSO|nr:translation initiation factor 2 [Porphyridium sordidum]AOM66526.1 translation initiation factor 2 [Porphyridium sordidum]
MVFQLEKYLKSYNKIKINYILCTRQCGSRLFLNTQRDEKYETVIDLQYPKLFKEDIAIEQKKEYKNSINVLNSKENIIIKGEKSDVNKNYSSKNKNKKSIIDDTDDVLQTKKNKLKRKEKQRDDEYYEEDGFITSNLDNTDKTSYTNLEWSIMRPKMDSVVTRKSAQVNRKKNIPNKNVSKHVKNEVYDVKESISDLPININSNLSIADFSEVTKIPDYEIIKFLFIKGIQATINQIIDTKTAQLVADHFKVKIVTNSKNPTIQTQGKEKGVRIKANDLVTGIEDLEARAPVVAIFGHVDHGKTTLLDKIRQSNVANQEAGGITQRLAAYEVVINITDNPEKIIFLDTPGHKAFSAMRSRGANLTDISILIVAADDGIQPQTLEALEQIQNSNCKLIVAINKIDKPTANIEKVTNELTKYNVISEKLGGDTKFVEISAKQGINIDSLLKIIIDTAKEQELYANPRSKAKGVIIESYLDKSRGAITTVLIQDGTLNVGDICVSSSTYGRIRAMVSNGQDNIKSAGPSSIIEVLGLSDIANVGDILQTVGKEKEAKSILSVLKHNSNLDDLSGSRISIKSTEQQQINKKVFRLIIKAETQGSLEAILDSLKAIPQSKIQIGLINASLGDIKETDIELANTTDAIIIAFNTTIHNSAKSLVNKHQISIEYFKVIYDLLEFVENKMKEMIEPEFIQEEIGEAIVKNIFNISKGTVAGCFIKKGKLIRGCRLTVSRDNQKVFEGTLDSLKQIKNDVYELEQNNECGIVVNDYQDWNKNDLITAYIFTPKSPEL